MAESSELEQIRGALLAARKQIDLEVERRNKAEQDFERTVSAEKARMRKQLHDGLGQMLTSISFLASALRNKLITCGMTDTAEVDEIISLVNEAIAESRAIAANYDTTPRASLLA